MRKFLLGLNDVKNTVHIKQKLCEIKFPKKNSVEAYLYPRNGAGVGKGAKICVFEI